MYLADDEKANIYIYTYIHELMKNASVVLQHCSHNRNRLKSAAGGALCMFFLACISICYMCNIVFQVCYVLSLICIFYVYSIGYSISVFHVSVSFCFNLLFLFLLLIISAVDVFCCLCLDLLYIWHICGAAHRAPLEL